MPDFTDRYERPLGSVAQRGAGILLGVGVAAVGWIVVSDIVVRFRDRGSLQPAAIEFLCLGVLCWCALLAVRLVRLEFRNRPLLPPIGIVLFGLLLGVGVCFMIAFAIIDHDTGVTGRTIFEGLLATAAMIGVGLRRMRRGSGT